MSIQTALDEYNLALKQGQKIPGACDGGRSRYPAVWTIFCRKTIRIPWWTWGWWKSLQGG